MTPSDLEYVTFDVFTETRFEGNPLAIVKVPRSVTLSQEQKQAITLEFNLSETVFLHDRPEGSEKPEWKIDIFTLTRELPFAGHPTIGTALYTLSGIVDEKDLSASGPDGKVEGTLVTKAGPIPVTYASGFAKAHIPHNVHIHSKPLLQSHLCDLQPGLASLAEGALKDSPVVSIVKGMTFALVELPDLETLSKASTTAEHTKADLDLDWDDSFVACYFYVRPSSPVDGKRQLRTRMIEYTLEDPATGSAASALSAYLTMQEGEAGQTLAYEIVQGVEMGRRSEIGVEVCLGKDRRIEDVVLSGKAVQVMEGRLRM